MTLTLLRLVGLFVLAAGGFVSSALAQTYTNTSSAPLDETVASCSATPLSRSFSVADTGTLGDVDLSVLITHTYRGDLDLVLESPAGTRVQLTTQNGGVGGNNINATFDDGAATPYTSFPAATDQSASAPPYENDLSPESPLSAFNGESMTGTWTLEMCDAFNLDSGDFQRADLILTTAGPTADVSLDLVASPLNPATGSTTTLTYTIQNDGPNAASGLTVLAPVPAALSYVSDSVGGDYDDATGIWTLPGSLASGSSAVLTITTQANASGSGAIVAEVLTSSLSDLDSTPDNRNTAPLEDDTASATIVVNGPAPGTPPTLTCDVATETFDWDSNAWTAGALSQSYTTGVGFDFAFTGSTGFFQSFGGQTPLTSNGLSGGLSPAQQALLYVVNFTSSSQRLDLTVDVGTPGEGVEGLQFTLFDVDINPSTASNANFIDRVTVFGYLDGVATVPTLTEGTVNSVSGPVATGNASGASASGEGNVVVTFQSPVDQIVLFYDNDPAVVSNPGQQGVAVHDIEYCPRGRDYSDAPASYGEPYHLITDGLLIGATGPDRDTAGLPSANATDDDTSGTDDEDGLSLPALTQGDVTSVSVPVSGTGGLLSAWFDWDGDGSFDVSEQAAADLSASGGSVTVPISVPIGATTSQTYARLRWSSQAGLGPDGAAGDGEVEDFALLIAPNASLICPAGFSAVSGTGYAGSVIVTALNSTNALGLPEAVGVTATNSNAARVNNGNRTLVLELEDFVPGNADMDIRIARDNGSGNVDIDVSPDNVSYTNIASYSAGPNDVIASLVVQVPSAGAQYIRFQRTGGATRIAGLEYNDICSTTVSGALLGEKTTAIYDPLSEGLFAIPGNDMIYTITVENAGPATDPNTIVLIDALPDRIEVFTGNTPEFGNAVVGWSESGTGLTFDPAVDVGYATGTTAPAEFDDCGYAPVSTYDPAITYICFNPKGAMASGSPNPEFSISFRGRIR